MIKERKKQRQQTNAMITRGLDSSPTFHSNKQESVKRVSFATKQFCIRFRRISARAILSRDTKKIVTMPSLTIENNWALTHIQDFKYIHDFKEIQDFTEIQDFKDIQDFRDIQDIEKFQDIMHLDRMLDL